MYKPEDPDQHIHSQHNCYTQRIIELEAESEEKELRHRQLLKKITQMTSSQATLQQQFAQYQQQVRAQSCQMQQTLEDRNGCILMLRSQLTAVEQSNQNLYSLLKQSNGKVVQLMKELTDKNRFIKEYIQKQQDQ